MFSRDIQQVIEYVCRPTLLFCRKMAKVPVVDTNSAQCAQQPVTIDGSSKFPQQGTASTQRSPLINILNKVAAADPWRHGLDRNRTTSVSWEA